MGETAVKCSAAVLQWNVCETRLSLVSALSRDGMFCPDCAVQGVNQRLELDEFVPCALGIVAIEGSGQHLRMGVSVLDHAIAGLLQCFKSLVHLCS
nr:hypothetical protein [Bradyrhizobium sp. UNPF46]